MLCQSSKGQFAQVVYRRTRSTNTTVRLLHRDHTNKNDHQIHTLLLCRHGNSIWNGGEIGTFERFTGWTNIPLSDKGRLEAAMAAKHIVSSKYRIGASFTSVLHRAQETADICLSEIFDHYGGANDYSSIRQHTDFRLNERHYGALQGLEKEKAGKGLCGYDSADVRSWRRHWDGIPPFLGETDARRLQETETWSKVCGGAENVPRGESLEMVAQNRISPFLRGVLFPTMREIQKDTREHDAVAGLVIAHKNSLRALIGIMCRTEEDNEAMEVLESMKIPTGLPLVLQFYFDEKGQWQVVRDNELSEDQIPHQKIPLCSLAALSDHVNQTDHMIVRARGSQM
uniref:phosphoglycerate mutase (2,3-diphosphoglycerate-dependent) n=1 Tax=Leptocylindrus danicus TaxID=163516 RepID=A0A7S2KWD2_9STRA|mmetsp:Transcript_2712/g.3882  ORF Transcript_2712/g.3882 Transcript_2712/m.3882 type:complete len:342 (+) Transcript_2712:65-1090(+)|eukprot:CAMPEP_0116010190 /NCGR_PEP_ID=MMETSP0321-20121206/3864_1 /TAXON_ID=163516 /ORGANISM="Leptocylindrus danicus var. danicus, Strain B650" /LENGTH=341 /DNA_ID=CAMNT_0003479263 /DNA_START=1 /DNA_END=1026 /DNA_ORIENTATION=+